MDNSTLRRVQMVQLEIAKVIKKICDENGIDYFMVGGTLLGAVRHNGFIPWDDDLDIGMLREDYEKFISLADKALPSSYALVEWSKDKDYPHPMAKVVKRGTVYLEEKRKDTANQGIWVDLFPYDAVPMDEKCSKKQGRVIMLCRGLVRAKCKYQTWHSQGKFLVDKWIKNIPLRMMAFFCSKQKLVECYETTAKQYNEEPCDLYFENGPDKYGKWSMPVECFDELIELPFEDTSFKAPKGFDMYLRTAYGDYMQLPPESERGNQHSILQVDFGEED